jgi:hypothetical protein
VVTLGSPQLAPLAVHPLVRVQLQALGTLGSLGAPGLFRRSCLEDECCAEFWTELAGPMPAGVGLVAIYSRSDGIVDWRACLDPGADEQVEIGSSHVGMAVSPAAWKAVAGALKRFGESEAPRPAAARRLRRAA